MDYDDVDLHVARKKMRLKNSNSCLSFVYTIWKGNLVLCCFNNISKEIANISCVSLIEHSDVDKLEILIREFLFGEVSKRFS